MRNLIDVVARNRKGKLWRQNFRIAWTSFPRCSQWCQRTHDAGVLFFVVGDRPSCAMALSYARDYVLAVESNKLEAAEIAKSAAQSQSSAASRLTIR